jgi:hypothetical protein
MMGQHELVNQPTARPTAKVLATWLTGGGATVVLAVAAALTETVDSTTVVGALVTAVAAGLAGYVQKNRRVDQ